MMGRNDRRVFLAASDLRIWGLGILKDTHAYLDSVLWFVLMGFVFFCFVFGRIISAELP